MPMMHCYDCGGRFRSLKSHKDGPTQACKRKRLEYLAKNNRTFLRTEGFATSRSPQLFDSAKLPAITIRVDLTGSVGDWGHTDSLGARVGLSILTEKWVPSWAAEIGGWLKVKPLYRRRLINWLATHGENLPVVDAIYRLSGPDAVRMWVRANCPMLPYEVAAPEWYDVEPVP